jgi:type I site-specific restriction-modification system R (restriction) subunit
MRAVERALVRAYDPTKKRGLVWHTQGSGKTYTMITIAKRLIEEPVFDNPTVLMLVDRNELETQLFGNLAATLMGKDVRPVTKAGFYTNLAASLFPKAKRDFRNFFRMIPEGYHLHDS